MKILRDAFAAMFKDKDFQQDVDKLGWNDELIRGDELNKKVDGLVHNEIGDGLFSKNIAIASFRADPSFWLAFFLPQHCRIGRDRGSFGLGYATFPVGDWHTCFGSCRAPASYGLARRRRKC